MKIILLKLWHPFPCRPAKRCSHLIRKNPFLSVTPNIVIMVRIVLALFRLPEPPMLIGRMIQYQIHDDLDSFLICFRNQAFHILQTPKHRINVLIVRNVVSIVILRGTVYRRKPDCVNSQIRQIIQPRNDPRKISDSIPIAVLKTSRINLIYDLILPPLFCHTLKPPLNLNRSSL